jgi:hypothetical protein
MVAPTCFGITLPSSGSVSRAFWQMLNWGAVDRILWMGVLCLVAWWSPRTHTWQNQLKQPQYKIHTKWNGHNTTKYPNYKVTLMYMILLSSRTSPYLTVLHFTLTKSLHINHISSLHITTLHSTYLHSIPTWIPLACNYTISSVPSSKWQYIALE